MLLHHVDLQVQQNIDEYHDQSLQIPTVYLIDGLDYTLVLSMHFHQFPPHDQHHQ